jgi:FAD/FMN-containing dehydrogenase
MTAQSVVDATGKELGEQTINELRAGLRGDVVRPGDGEYDVTRKIWNAMIDRRPSLIIRPAGPADVVQTVDFARDNRMVLSVRSGGHNIAGTSVCEGGILLDLSRMKALRVDRQRQTARAELGLRWGEFDRETTAFGLATTGGTNTDTGIGGLSLGGGIGWLGGKYGLVVDNLLSADIVTADGQLRTVSAEQEPDLFWALRGGGGNFGVVTSLEYRLYPVAPMLAGLIVHPFQAARDVLRVYAEFAEAAPDELGTLAVLMHTPTGDKGVGIAFCYNGPVDEAERVMRPLREFQSPAMEQVGVMPYPAIQGMADEMLPGGRNYYAKAPFLKEFNLAAAEEAVGYYEKVPSPFSVVLFQQKRGQMMRGGEETAFGQRNSPCNMVILSSWEERRDDEANIAWARSLALAVEPLTTGASYFNDLGLESEEGSAPVRAAFGERYSRLVEIKNRYDPMNLFRHNQNIRPTVDTTQSP